MNHTLQCVQHNTLQCWWCVNRVFHSPLWRRLLMLSSESFISIDML